MVFQGFSARKKQTHRAERFLETCGVVYVHVFTDRGCNHGSPPKCRGRLTAERWPATGCSQTPAQVWLGEQLLASSGMVECGVWGRTPPGDKRVCILAYPVGDLCTERCTLGPSLHGTRIELGELGRDSNCRVGPRPYGSPDEKGEAPNSCCPSLFCGLLASDLTFRRSAAP